MKIYSIILLLIFSVTIVIPIANAQISNEVSNQKSIEVTITPKGEMHVKHVIDEIDLPSQIELVEGTISNLTVKDQEGNDIQYGEMGDNGFLMILPSGEESVIEYDVSDKLILKDNVWTLDFLYLESTAFIFPEQVDLIFVSDKPAFLGEKKGILCHGCQMILEYSIDEPKIFEIIKIQDKEILIEIRSWAEINQFSFDSTLDEINYEVMGENAFVTTIIPIDFMVQPYQVFLDGEKIFFHDYINNGTHVWLNLRPQNSGEVSITGTVMSVIEVPPEPEFSVEYVVVGIIIIGIIIAAVFFFKRKK